MKKIKLLLLLFSILVLALNSCVLLFIPVSQSFPDCADEKLLSIRKGMTSEDVNEVMLSHTSGLIYDVYLIEDIKSDTHDISEMIKSKNKTTILITQKKNINGELFFIFAFENDK
ncbi:MAG: hypothetical protein KAH48_11460, partial [Chlorobi bacterium]|nr:hypothetical protein [Chlorobiota bacterium]